MSQIKKKFIENNAIDGSKVQLLNGQTLRAIDNTGADRDLFYFSSSNEWYLSVSPKISIDPLVNNDLVRKYYVDTQVSNEASAREAADLAEQSRAQAAEASIASDLATETSRAQSAESTLQSNIDSESSARTSADSAESAARQAADSAETSARESADSAEAATRLASDQALSGRLDVVEGSGEGSVAKAKSDAQAYADQKVADLVNSAPAVLDTLKELADALGSDPNFATTVANQIGTESSARQAADSAETAAREAAVSAEQSARQAADSTLQSNIDSEAATRSSADQTLQSNIDSEATSRQAADSAETAAREAAVSAETSARQAADSTLQSNIDSEASARSSADQTLQGNIDSEATSRQAADSAETASRQSDVADLQGQIDALDSGSTAGLTSEIARATAAEAALQAAIDSEVASRSSAVAAEATARSDADDVLQSNIDSESSARTSADSALSGRLDVVEGTGDGSIKKAVADLVASAPMVLDTLKELADALGSDPNFATTVANSIGSETSRAQAAEASIASDLATETSRAQAAEASIASDLATETSRAQSAESAEQSARQTADGALDTRVAALEAVHHSKEKFILTSMDVMQGFIDLSATCVSNSEIVFVDSLYLHSDEGYTVSTVGGVTRITFSGIMASGGASALVAGDTIYVRYKTSTSGGGGGGGGGTPSIFLAGSPIEGETTVTFNWNYGSNVNEYAVLTHADYQAGLWVKVAVLGPITNGTATINKADILALGLNQPKSWPYKLETSTDSAGNNRTGLETSSFNLQLNLYDAGQPSALTYTTSSSDGVNISIGWSFTNVPLNSRVALMIESTPGGGSYLDLVSDAGLATSGTYTSYSLPEGYVRGANYKIDLRSATGAVLNVSSAVFQTIIHSTINLTSAQVVGNNFVINWTGSAVDSGEYVVLVHARYDLGVWEKVSVLGPISALTGSVLNADLLALEHQEWAYKLIVASDSTGSIGQGFGQGLNESGGFIPDFSGSGN